ncbi:MAG: DUF962 domain-containing protein [Bacteriovoracales bacterium]
MKKIDLWLSEYAKSHQNKTNEKIHWFCVPLITFSLLGLLWSIPTPELFIPVAYLNFATLFCAFSLFFYLGLGFRVAFFLAIPILFMLWIISILAKGDYLLPISSGIFILSWLVQFIGHKVEGKKPSFLKNILFFLVGPIWLLRNLNLV